METVSLYNPVISTIVKTRLANLEKPVVVYLDKDACFICGGIPQGVFSVHDCCCTIACFTCTLNLLTATAMADDSNSVSCLECKKEVRTIIASEIPARNCRQRQQLLESHDVALDVLTYIRNRRLQFERPSPQERSSCRSFISFYDTATIVRKNSTGLARTSSIRAPYARALVGTEGISSCSLAQKYFNVYFLHKKPSVVPPAPFGPSGGGADGAVGMEAGGIASVEADGLDSVRMDGTTQTDGPGCVEADGPGCAEADGPGCAEADGPGCVEADGPGCVKADGPGCVKADGPGCVKADDPGSVEATGPAGVKTDGPAGVDANGSADVKADDTAGVGTDCSFGNAPDGLAGVKADGPGGVKVNVPQ